MIPTKFYNIDNEALLFLAMYKNTIDIDAPRRQRSIFAKIAPWAVAFLACAGYSALKLAGA